MVHRITGSLDFFHRPVFLGVEIRRLGKWICLRPQVGGGGEKVSTQFGPLERANINHWTKNPIILRAIHHSQNPIKSTKYAGYLPSLLPLHMSVP
jgi:hypothetical protein